MFHNEGQGSSDFDHDLLAPECKLLSAVRWSDVLDAINQAERNADGGKIAVAMMRKKGHLTVDTVACMRLGDLRRLIQMIEDLRTDAYGQKRGEAA